MRRLVELRTCRFKPGGDAVDLLRRDLAYAWKVAG